jgi:hypothetical protein
VAESNPRAATVKLAVSTPVDSAAQPELPTTRSTEAAPADGSKHGYRPSGSGIPRSRKSERRKLATETTPKLLDMDSVAEDSARLAMRPLVPNLRAPRNMRPSQLPSLPHRDSRGSSSALPLPTASGSSGRQAHERLSSDSHSRTLSTKVTSYGVPLVDSAVRSRRGSIATSRAHSHTSSAPPSRSEACTTSNSRGSVFLRETSVATAIPVGVVLDPAFHPDESAYLALVTAGVMDALLALRQKRSTPSTTATAVPARSKPKSKRRKPNLSLVKVWTHSAEEVLTDTPPNADQPRVTPRMLVVDALSVTRHSDQEAQPDSLTLKRRPAHPRPDTWDILARAEELGWAVVAADRFAAWLRGMARALTVSLPPLVAPNALSWEDLLSFLVRGAKASSKSGLQWQFLPGMFPSLANGEGVASWQQTWERSTQRARERLWSLPIALSPASRTRFVVGDAWGVCPPLEITASPRDTPLGTTRTESAVPLFCPELANPHYPPFLTLGELASRLGCKAWSPDSLPSVFSPRPERSWMSFRSRLAGWAEDQHFFQPQGDVALSDEMDDDAQITRLARAQLAADTEVEGNPSSSSSSSSLESSSSRAKQPSKQARGSRSPSSAPPERGATAAAITAYRAKLSQQQPSWAPAAAGVSPARGSSSGSTHILKSMWKMWGLEEVAGDEVGSLSPEMPTESLPRAVTDRSAHAVPVDASDSDLEAVASSLTRALRLSRAKALAAAASGTDTARDCHVLTRAAMTTKSPAFTRTVEGFCEVCKRRYTDRVAHLASTSHKLQRERQGEHWREWIARRFPTLSVGPTATGGSSSSLSASVLGLAWTQEVAASPPSRFCSTKILTASAHRGACVEWIHSRGSWMVSPLHIVSRAGGEHPSLLHIAKPLSADLTKTQGIEMVQAEDVALSNLVSRARHAVNARFARDTSPRRPAYSSPHRTTDPKSTAWNKHPLLVAAASAIRDWQACVKGELIASPSPRNSKRSRSSPSESDDSPKRVKPSEVLGSAPSNSASGLTVPASGNPATCVLVSPSSSTRRVSPRCHNARPSPGGSSQRGARQTRGSSSKTLKRANGVAAKAIKGASSSNSLTRVSGGLGYRALGTVASVRRPVSLEGYDMPSSPHK